jgi:hypothetical protein
MSSLDETRSIERQRFFDGQRLFAADVQRIEEFNREMRWLHNQSLHQPGIGNGFAVRGHKGDREVGVAPGYAVDDLGREIVMTSMRIVPVPPVAGDGLGGAQRFALTIHYPDDEDLEEVELRAGICDTRGAVRLREEPILCWVPLHPDGSPAVDASEILSGRALVIAEVAVRDCRLDQDISIAQRRNARPPTQPYIACGVQAPVDWEAWDPGAGTTVNGIDVAAALRILYRIAGGLQAKVDTRSAGFRTVPGYFARIDGDRTFTIEADGPQTVVLDGQLSIVTPTATGFEVRVIVLQFAANHPEVPPPPPPPDPGPIISFVGPLLGGGFDVSALMFDPVSSVQVPVAAPGSTAADAPAASAISDLPILAKGAWTIGWMGVEG